MRKLFLFVIALIPMVVTAETLKTPGFWVNYDNNWVVTEFDDPPGYQLSSADLETTATFSSLGFPKGKDLSELADAYLRVRLEAERETLKASERTATIKESQKPIQIGYQIEYWGTDSENRNFRYWAVVADTKIVNIYIESSKQDPAKLEEIFRFFLSDLKF